MATSDDVVSPLLGLLREEEQRLHLRRRDILGQLGPVREALERYGRALEEVAAIEYAKNHKLKLPATSGVSPRLAAEALLLAVERLPELSDDDATVEPSSEGPGAGLAPTDPGAKADQRANSEDSPARDQATGARDLSAVLPRVAAACRTQKLVIVGALSGRKKSLPAPLEGATEWLDTSGATRRTVGVPQRIKSGAIFALIICDQSVAHQHTEPLLAAARAKGIPVGFAGKGGAGAIARALEAIEEQLTD